MKTIISGYGRMGHMIEKVLLRKGHQVVLASGDICSVDKDLAKECVCIDFTTPDAFKANYKFIASHFKAAVVGTTGWNDIIEDVLDAFAEYGCTLIYSSNFSIGVNAVFAALESIGKILAGNGYTPHIEEIHHIHKKDAPSGTAKTMAEIVEQATGLKAETTSIREGEVPGTHTVTFLSGVDKITVSHEAFSREGFAEGAVLAAELTEKFSGIFTFKELILK